MNLKDSFGLSLDDELRKVNGLKKQIATCLLTARSTTNRDRVSDIFIHLHTL